MLLVAANVFKKWLDTTSDATWNKLIRALKSPGVQLDYFAGQLEQMMTTECKTYIKCYFGMAIGIHILICSRK